MRAENGPRLSKLLRVREFVDTPIKRSAAGTAKRKSRFVAPSYFSADTQAAIEALLGQAGLGDAEGRQLFITAAEYEIGTFRSAPAEAAAPARPKAALPLPRSRADIELAQLGQSAAQFLALLRQTGKTARAQLGERLGASDPFGRVHDERYLHHLELELGRIAAVGAQQREEPAPEPAAPPISEAARQLIQQLARIFGECLEVKLRPAELEVFSQVLCLIRDGAQVSFPCEPDLLARVLSDAK